MTIIKLILAMELNVNQTPLDGKLPSIAMFYADTDPSPMRDSWEILKYKEQDNCVYGAQDRNGERPGRALRASHVSVSGRLRLSGSSSICSPPNGVLIWRPPPICTHWPCRDPVINTGACNLFVWLIQIP